MHREGSSNHPSYWGEGRAGRRPSGADPGAADSVVVEIQGHSMAGVDEEDLFDLAEPKGKHTRRS